MTVLLARADQAVSANAMARSFGANLKRVTSGQQCHLVVFKHDEPAAVLMGIEAFQAICDELDDLRTCWLVVQRLSRFDESKCVTHEDLVARYK